MKTIIFDDGNGHQYFLDVIHIREIKTERFALHWSESKIETHDGRDIRVIVPEGCGDFIKQVYELMYESHAHVKIFRCKSLNSYPEDKQARIELDDWVKQAMG